MSIFDEFLFVVCGGIPALQNKNPSQLVAMLFCIEYVNIFKETNLPRHEKEQSLL